MATRVDTEEPRTDFTEGSIIGSILKMGLPSMFGFLAQHIYAMADMFWVSRLESAEAGVAAITFCTNLFWMLWSLNQLVGPGSVAVISRRYGEKNYAQAEKAIKETFLLKLSFGVAMAVPGWFLMPFLLTYIGAEGETLRLAIGYGRIMMIGMPVMFATYSVFTALRSIANPNWAMSLMIGSNILNAAVDPLLIFGYLGLPALGINGAAIASVSSLALTFILGIVLLRTNWTNVRLHLRSEAALSVTSMLKIVRIGVPSFLGEVSFSASRLVVTPIVAGFGTAVVAAYGVGTQLFGFGITILVGMGLGLSSLIGHNVGALKQARAKSTADRSILLGVGVMGILAIFTLLFAETYMKIFFPESPLSVGHGTQLLRIWALAFPLFGVFIMLEQIHLGVGLNTPSMVIVAIHSWGFQVLPIILVTQVLGLSQVAIWWVFSVSAMVSSMVFYLYYRRGRWLTVQV